MTTPTPPDYSGGSLVNLIAEIEHRLTGSAPAPRLHAALGNLIPDAPSYIVVLFDGLGAGQLNHPRAATMAGDLSATIDAPFPTTTTVSLATIASGTPPAQHGIIGYQLWMPEVEAVANTIKWTTLWGEPLEIDTGRLLPSPNLWERLGAAGKEAITVQPHGFAGSPLSRLLYRGCRFEGVATTAELVSATRQLAAEPGRLVFAYVPHVDFAAHVYGQHDPRYADAVATADDVWSRLAATLPPGAVMIGTADHGHVDFPKDRQIKISNAAHRNRVFYGDGRAMYVRGEGTSLASELPATWLDVEEIRSWWGPGPDHPALSSRAPDGVLLADDGVLLLHKHSDDRMVGNHGGLTDAERRIPLLVRPQRD
jgi:hypothetical protein